MDLLNRIKSRLMAGPLRADMWALFGVLLAVLGVVFERTGLVAIALLPVLILGVLLEREAGGSEDSEDEDEFDEEDDFGLVA